MVDAKSDSFLRSSSHMMQVLLEDISGPIGTWLDAALLFIATAGFILNSQIHFPFADKPCYRKTVYKGILNLALGIIITYRTTVRLG